MPKSKHRRKGRLRLRRPHCGLPESVKTALKGMAGKVLNINEAAALFTRDEAFAADVLAEAAELGRDDEWEALFVNDEHFELRRGSDHTHVATFRGPLACCDMLSAWFARATFDGRNTEALVNRVRKAGGIVVDPMAKKQWRAVEKKPGTKRVPGVTIRLGETLKGAVRMSAHLANTSMAQWVRDAVEQRVEREGVLVLGSTNDEQAVDARAIAASTNAPEASRTSPSALESG